MTLETIKTETLKLRRMELLELVQFVVEALKKQEQISGEDELSPEWKAEILSRQEEIRNGKAELYSYKEVQEELNKEFGFDITIP
ncbi:MAG: hypothetical protein EPO28_06500 [Saprospiraceae bacterium]|nr:MAG: hypothetical protein EPO28_06500 [Saprospiraceae bacterium]